MGKAFFSCALIALGMISLVIFESWVVPAALSPRLDGTYGELYGPVSSLRFHVDAACVGLMAIGVFLIGVSMIRKQDAGAE